MKGISAVLKETNQKLNIHSLEAVNFEAFWPLKWFDSK